MDTIFCRMISMKSLLVFTMGLMCYQPSEGGEHSHHNQERFVAAHALYNKGAYEKALLLFKQNIAETPTAMDIDYDYAWATDCLAKMCRYDEFAKFYETVCVRFSGPVESGGVVRYWEKTLKEARRTILACPFMNAKTITDQLDDFERRGKAARRARLDYLVHLASMGNRDAARDLQLSPEELIESIVRGDLVLAKDAGDIDATQATADTPYVRKRGDSAWLYLPPKMQEAMRVFSPDFRPWKLKNYDSMLRDCYSYSDNNLPFVALGNFNEDSIRDAVIDGHTNAAHVVLCILSSDSGYRAIPVDSFEISGWSDSTYLDTYLTFEPRGVIKTSYEDDTLHLTTDAFEICIFEKASTLYYLKGNKFYQYTTGD